MRRQIPIQVVVDMSSADIAWEPYGYYRIHSNVAQFMDEYGYKSPADLAPGSEDEIATFWRDAIDDLGVVWDEPPDEILDASGRVEFPDWFPGARLNATRTALDRWVERTPAATAIAWESERGDTRKITYRELDRRVGRVANALRDAGIGRGDRIGILFPLHVHALVTALAALKVGAVQTHVFPGYGVDAVADRLADAEVEVLVSADGYVRKGTEIPLRPKVREVLASVPTVERVVEFSNLGLDGSLDAVETETWESFVADRSDEAETAVLAATDPAIIAYSSGTTGKPKGTIHTHTSIAVAGQKDAAYQFDLSPGDSFCWVTDFGWVVVAVWMIGGSLARGATTVLLDGSPVHPDEDRLWQAVEEYEITTLGTSPTGVRGLRDLNPRPRESHDLSTLRVLCSSGEPWRDMDNWLWYHEAVGGGHLPVINVTGGTEAFAGLASGTPRTPLKPGTVYGPAPGIPTNVYGEDGDPSDEGYLVVERPFPGMTRGLTSDRERYLEEYWSDFEGAWNQNDWVEVDADGFWFVRGRADDAMNVSGRRITSPSLEAAVTDHPDVEEAVVVGVEDEARGEVPVGFVLASDAGESLWEEVNEIVADQLGAPFRLAELHVVAALPRTQTGKVPRKVVRSAYEGKSYDPSTLESGEVLDEYPRKGSE